MIIDLKNYEKDKKVFKRTASRGVIKREDKFLMIYSKFGDYKFPGGGVKKGETLIEALIREVKEETGYIVEETSVRQYMEILERRKGEYDDILEMKSFYYFCNIKEETGERNLDDYEKEYDYQIVWISLLEAIEKNREMKNRDKCPWVVREQSFMEHLLKGNE